MTEQKTIAKLPWMFLSDHRNIPRLSGMHAGLDEREELLIFLMETGVISPDARSEKGMLGEFLFRDVVRDGKFKCASYMLQNMQSASRDFLLATHFESILKDAARAIRGRTDNGMSISYSGQFIEALWVAKDGLPEITFHEPAISTFLKELEPTNTNRSSEQNPANDYDRQLTNICSFILSKDGAGETNPLFLSAKTPWGGISRMLMEHGFSPEDKDSNGTTPFSLCVGQPAQIDAMSSKLTNNGQTLGQTLYYTLYRNSFFDKEMLQQVEKLIADAADPNWTNSETVSTFTLSCKKREIAYPLVKELSKGGYRMKGWSTELDSIVIYFFDYLFNKKSGKWAGKASEIAEESRNMVLALHDMGFSFDTPFPNKNNRTLLHLLIEHQLYDAAKTAITLGAKPNAPDKDGLTPFHLLADSAYNGQPAKSIFISMMNNGGDPFVCAGEQRLTPYEKFISTMKNKDRNRPGMSYALVKWTAGDKSILDLMSKDVETKINSDGMPMREILMKRMLVDIDCKIFPKDLACRILEFHIINADSVTPETRQLCSLYAEPGFFEKAQAKKLLSKMNVDRKPLHRTSC